MSAKRFRRLDDAFTGVYATTWADGFDVVAGGPAGPSERDPRPARISVVTGNFFDVLGVRPRLGRALRPHDDADCALPVLEVDTVDEQLDHALSRDRLVTQLSLFFGGLAAMSDDGPGRRTRPSMPQAA